jgi:MFS transporter, putative metabolite:H+ symporter
VEGNRASRHLLERQHWFLLYVLGVAAFFEGYDLFAVTSALPQIRETFGLSQSEASAWLSVPILGALPAVWFSRRADLHGRRGLLWVSIIGFTVFTGATAFSPRIEVFIAMQFLAFVFLTVEGALAWTMVAEELPAGARGFGFGWLAMLTALGSGWASILYGGIFAPLDMSWRWLYIVALPPLATVAMLRRRLPESRRFVALKESGHVSQSWKELMRPPNRRWVVLVCLTAFLGALATQAGVFVIDFMQEDRGLSATAANFILVGAGALAIPVLVGSGQMSDRYGRKVVGVSFGLLSAAGGIGFFLFARGGWMLFVFMFLLLVGQFGSWPTLGAFGSELFPTAHRALAGSWASVARVAGQSVSFALGGVLIAVTNKLSTAAIILGAGPVVALFIVWIFFPETKGRELEDITGESLPIAPLPFGP